MPIPLLVIAAVAVAGTGGGLAISGSCKMKRAQERGRRAEARSKRSHTTLKRAAESLNARSAEYGALKSNICNEIIFPVWERFPRARRKMISQFPDMAWLEDLLKKNSVEYSFRKGDLGVTKSTLKGAGAGTALASGTYAAVGLLAKAGTGTAISALSGAAAKSATLAWLGGGTLASGGAGVAGGTLAVGSIAAAPVVLFIGIGIAAKGEKAKTKATHYEAEVDKLVEEHRKARILLQGGVKRIAELEGLLTALAGRARTLMDSLETCDASIRFRNTRLLLGLVRALCDIMTVPVITDDFETTERSEEVLHRYERLSG